MVGIRGRGFSPIRNFSQEPNVEVAAICEVDETVMRQRLADMEKAGMPKPKTYVDYQKLLEDKSSTPSPSPPRTIGTR